MMWDHVSLALSSLASKHENSTDSKVAPCYKKTEKKYQHNAWLCNPFPFVTVICAEKC